RCSVLDEAHERCYARTRADHNYWLCCVLWQIELALRWLQEDLNARMAWDRLALQHLADLDKSCQTVEPGCAHTLALLALWQLVLDYVECTRNPAMTITSHGRVGDGVIARLVWGQCFNQTCQWDILDRWECAQNI